MVGEAVLKAMERHIDMRKALGGHGNIGGMEAHLLHRGADVKGRQRLFTVAQMLAGELNEFLSRINGKTEVDDFSKHDTFSLNGMKKGKKGRPESETPPFAGSGRRRSDE